MSEIDEGDRLAVEADRKDNTNHPPTQRALLTAVADKEARKLEARRTQDHSVWFGLGMFGMIGWAVAIPALAALALGLWLDRRWPLYFSWTLTLLFCGIALGCLNAWFWVTRERERIESRTHTAPPLPAQPPTATGEEPHDE